MALLLLAHLAFAEAPADPSTSITQLPEGTVITFDPSLKIAPIKLTTYSYLLPEQMYDKALIKAKQLDVCQPALESATAQTLGWVDVSQKALNACSTQFGADATTIEGLRKQVVDLDVRAATAENHLHDARTKTVIAWAITSGLVLGAIAATAVAIGN